METLRCYGRSEVIYGHGIVPHWREWYATNEVTSQGISMAKARQRELEDLGYIVTCGAMGMQELRPGHHMKMTQLTIKLVGNGEET